MRRKLAEFWLNGALRAAEFVPRSGRSTGMHRLGQEAALQGWRVSARHADEPAKTGAMPPTSRSAPENWLRRSTSTTF
jgi:hypothetical protein